MNELHLMGNSCYHNELVESLRKPKKADLYLPIGWKNIIRMALQSDEMRKKSNNIHKKI